MKKSFLFVCLLSAAFTLSSSSQKTAPYACFITFLQPDGTEITKDGYDAKYEDWSKPIVKAEFRKGEQPITLTGLLVYIPEKAEPLARSFTGNEELTRLLQEEWAKDEPIITLRRIIIDNIKEPDNKKNISPIVYSIHYSN